MSDLPVLPPLHEWHRVPVGATIPAGTPYMVCEYDDKYDTFVLKGAKQDLKASLSRPRWTPEPIAPPLPTEEGAQILARVDGSGHCLLLTRVSTGWARGHSSVVTLFDNDIDEWAPLPADFVWHTR